MIKQCNATKGVSVVLGYAMILAISVTMIALIVGAFGANLQQQKNNAIGSEMEIAAVQIATNIEKVDATVRKTNSVDELTSTPKFTDRAGDPGYKVYIDSNPTSNIYELKIKTQDQTITKQFRSLTPVDTTAMANSTSLQIVYRNSTNSITLENKKNSGVIVTPTVKTFSSDYTIPANTETVSLEVQGNVSGGNQSQVSGYLDVTKDINTDSNFSVYGTVSGRNVYLSHNSNIYGSIIATKSIQIGYGSMVQQSITGNQLNTGSNVVIGSDLNDTEVSIDTTGNVTIGSSSDITGTIQSNSTVTLNNFTTVTGHVNVPTESNLICGVNVTINGKDCSTYKNNNY